MITTPAAEATSTPGQHPLAHLLAAMRAILAAGDDRTRTQRDALTALLVRVVSAGLLYATQVVLARWIGIADYGIYVFVWTWVLVLGGVSHLGLNLAVIRLLPAYRETGQAALMRGLVRGSRLVALGLGTLVAAAGLLGLALLGPAVASPYVMPLYLALVCVPLYALTDVQDGIGRGHAWMDVALLPPYVLRPLTLLATMSGAYAAGFEMHAETAAAAAIVATWTTGIVQAALLGARLDRSPDTASGQHRQYAFRDWLAASLPLMAISAAEIVLQNADILVVSRFMTPADVGIYFAAAKTMSLILFVHYAVGSAVANRFATLHARGDREALRRFVQDAVNWTFWPSLASGLLILALGLPLLSLFGPEFEAGYPVMLILVAGFLARAAMGPAEFLLNMLGEHALCAAVLVASAALDVALCFALVPHHGLLGAAAATAISLAMAASLNYIVARRRLQLEIAIWHNLPRR